VEGGDRNQIEKVLRRIPSAAWHGFLATPGGRPGRRRLQAIDEPLAGVATPGAAGKVPTAARIAQLLGYGVMQDPKCGP